MIFNRKLHNAIISEIVIGITFLSLIFQGKPLPLRDTIPQKPNKINFI